MFWYLLILVSSTSAEFGFRYTNTSMANWTTCEGFLKNYTEDIDKLVNIDWKIFYFWDVSSESSYNIRFSKPSIGLIDRFRIQLEKELKDVNWNDTAVFMETAVDFSALFLRTNLTGQYRLIPSLAFEMPSCPYMVFALKVVEPGYLGIMNCKHRYAYALAPVDKMPPDDQIPEAAASLKFWNSLGRSYLTRPPPRHSTPRYEDDDIDDEELEIDRNFNAL